ncbi:MAG: trypsin-like peptidase domain-containing protein [Caldilineaceae bacterium]
MDLAVLIPSSAQYDITYLNVRHDPIVVGESVLLAGFPDEMNLPFAFDSILNYRHPEIQSQQSKLEYTRRLLMIKSGMVGHKVGFNFDGDDKLIIQGEIFYVDNAMHSGASGGPVIDTQGIFLE